MVSVTLPPRSPPKDVFLSRSEAAKLLLTAWRGQEVQKGRKTKKRTSKHIARFILVGLYSGSRHDAICGASFEPANDRGWVDLEKGTFHRLRQGRRQTKKRQPPVRIPRRLLFHLKRWRRLGISKSAVVEFQGAPLASVRKGFEAVVKKAGLAKHVTPHTLRHTSATWLMQQGKDLWTAAGFLGTSVQMLEQTYAKHHPDYQSDVLDAFASPGKTPGQHGIKNTMKQSLAAANRSNKGDAFDAKPTAHNGLVGGSSPPGPTTVLHRMTGEREGAFAGKTSFCIPLRTAPGCSGADRLNSRNARSLMASLSWRLAIALRLGVAAASGFRILHSCHLRPSARSRR